MNISKKILKNARHWLTGNQSGGTIFIDLLLDGRGGYLNQKLCPITDHNPRTTSTL